MQTVMLDIARGSGGSLITQEVVMTFEEWLRQVNLHIAKLTGGLVSDDLPDAPYYDMYDDGLGPQSAARRAIRNAS